MKGGELFFGDFATEALFTRDGLMFIMFCMVLVCEDPFLRDMGLSVEGLFGRFLGNAQASYVSYHVRRSQVQSNAFITYCKKVKP